jgi:hypothetical protein
MDGGVGGPTPEHFRHFAFCLLGGSLRNLGAMRVARAMGCNELDDIMADEQHRVMSSNTSKRWAKVNGMTATAHACAGGLAFAAMNSETMKEAHGHIAAVSPEPMQFSGSLNKNVPMVCNIGKVNADEKESLAFPVACGEPDYFIYD